MAIITGVIGVVCLLCCLLVSYSHECDEASLGVADISKIGDTQLKAMTETGGHPAKYGRLDGPKAWRPDHIKGDHGAESAVGDWIQVTFGTVVKVIKIATQGRNPDNGGGDNDDEYVTRYKVRYGYDDDSLMYIRNADGTDMVFNGNVDRGRTVEQVLPYAVLLKQFRIEIVECSPVGCAVRFELYGCQVPVCDVLDAPMNGHVTNTMTTVFTNGDMQTIECDDDFTPMGDTITVCTANGDAASWEPDTSSTSCVPVCDVLDAPMNGHVTNTVFTDGDMQMIECDDDFTPMGETSTVCTANGDTASWKTDISFTLCVPVCGILNAPMNGHVTNTPTTVFTDGDMQVIECDAGFTLMGKNSTVCTATGNAASWEPDTSSTTCVYTPTSAGRRGGPNPGAVAGPVIGVLLIIVIIIIVVIWLRKRKRETAKSTPQSGQAFDGPYELTIEGNNGPAKTQPTVVGQPDQEEYAYVDVNRVNTPQNEVKPDTGDIYQDVQDKPDEYAYAYADVNASKAADEPSDDGLVHIYAKSKHGGRPITKDKQNPAADTGDIYQAIQEDSNENEYAYADVKVDTNGEPANPQEGWEDNVIYAAGDDDEGIAADKGKEGWVDNNIYATTDNDAQNAEGKSQVEGWEDNIIYGDK